MLYKRVKFDIKAVSDTDVEGWASTFGNRDLGGDIIQQGAFKRSINNRLKSRQSFPMLWNHNADEPIGFWHPSDMRESPKGLKVRGTFVPAVRRALEVRELAKAGVLGGMSIGYEIPKNRAKVIRNDDGSYTRLIKEVKLWEISLVTFPMNTRATITDVKCTHCGEENEIWYDEFKDIWGDPDVDSPLILPQDLDDPDEKSASEESCGCGGSRGIQPSAETPDDSSLLKSLETLSEELRNERLRSEQSRKAD